MELGLTKKATDAMWFGLRTVRLDGLAHSALCTVFRGELSRRLAEDAKTREKLKDSEMLKGLGQLTLLANNGKVAIDPADLTPAWRALKAHETGVEFTDVFNPEEAALLEQITPPAAKKVD